MLALLPAAACGGPEFDPARFAGTWTGELTEARSATKLPTTFTVTADQDRLELRVDMRGGRPETFTMEVADGVAVLAETSSPRFGTVKGSLQADGYLSVEGRAVPGPIDWFELAGTWGEAELEAGADFGSDLGPGGKVRLTLRH